MAEGEEILSQYCFDPLDQEACLCGSTHCTGRIGLRSTKGPSLVDPSIYDEPVADLVLKFSRSARAAMREYDLTGNK
eukprot:3156119-Rhodomonas_salina.1